jgi:excisionase family DNA binding protein
MPPTNALPDLLTADEVAKAFRVAPQTVYRWGNKGSLRQVRIGQTIRFYRSDVEHLLRPDEVPAAL